jgi:hypothetical protein
MIATDPDSCYIRKRNISNWSKTMNNNFPSSHEIKKIFQEDVKEKKRASTGVFHRASRRGYIGSMRTAYSLLKGKDRRKYMGNGKVEIKYMSDLILPLEEFKKLSPEQMKERFNEWKEKFSDEEIQKAWNISNRGYYFIVLSRLGLHKSKNRKETHPDQPLDYSLDASVLKLIEEDLDAVVPFEIFQKLDKELQRSALRVWREKYGSSNIIEYWSISPNKMSDIIQALELPKLPKGRKNTLTSTIRINEKVLDLIGYKPSQSSNEKNKHSRRKKEQPSVITNMESLQELVSKTVEQAVQKHLASHVNSEVAVTSELPMKPVEVVTPSAIYLEHPRDGLNFQIEGEFDGKQAQDNILAFAMLLKENKRYKIQLQIREK